MNMRYAIEQLEGRRLLAVLFVNGTNGNDHITISADANFIYPLVNGVLIPQPTGLWDSVVVNAMDGDDLIRVDSTADDQVRVEPGNGADQIGICDVAGAADLDLLSSRVVVEQGTDSIDDVLRIVDSSDAGNDTYVIDQLPGPFRLTKVGSSAEIVWVSQNMHAIITLNGNDGTLDIGGVTGVAMSQTDGDITIQSNGSGNVSGTFNGTISNGNTLAITLGGTASSMIFNGDVFAGNATIDVIAPLLTISDSAATDSYNFNSGGTTLTLVDGAQTGTFIYHGADIGLSSTHSTQASTFNIDGLSSFSNLTISAGGGNDTFVVGDGAISSDDFGAGVDLFLSGGAGTDTLTIDDFANPSAMTHMWDNASYNHPAFGLLSYSSIASATLDAGIAGDTITIGTGLSLTTLTVNGNGGADNFDVTPNTTSVTCNGNLPVTSPGDDLDLIGAGATGGVLTAGAAGAGTYSFANRSPITFTSIESATQPGAAPSLPDLAAEDDSGISSTDNITNLTTLTLSGTGALAGHPIRLFRDGIQVATATAGGSAWTFDVSFPNGDGTFTMIARYENTNTGLLSLNSAALEVRVDTLTPSALGLPDLDAASDSGISSTDNITNDNTPTFNGTVTPNDIVRLFVSAVLAASDTTTASGSYSITTGVLTDGSKVVTTRVEDLAGNLSATSSGLVLTIDTIAPAAPSAAPDLVAASDTGVSDTDNLTRDVTPTFSGTAPGNHIVRLFAGSADVGFAQLPIAVTTYSVTSSALADGHHAMTTQFEDLAGNVSPAFSPSLTVQIDTVAPTLVRSVFQFLTGHGVGFTFNEDMAGGVSVSNFALKDVTNNVNIPASALALSYAPTTATVTFPGFASGILTDARWEMKANGDITDRAGNHFAGTLFQFFFLNGDANRDGTVNLADFNILASNFGQSNRDFASGDFNYDRLVNLNDFNLLASRFGTSLAPAAVFRGMIRSPLDLDWERDPLPI